MAAGIRDVAKKAGVSTATVSHVINNTHFVSAEMTRRVRSAMKELNYVPNYLAKSLKEKKSRVVGLVLPDISNYFFTEIAEEIERSLNKAGYSVILCNTNEDLEIEKAQIAQLKSYMVSGMIIAPTTMDFNYRSLVEEDYPLVFIDRRLDTVQGDNILVDCISVAEKAVEYLISKGHVKIGFIGAHMALSTTNDRYIGYRNALEKHGLELNPAYCAFGDARMASAYHLCESVVSRREVTALIVSSSLMSIGAMQYLVQAGIRIPEELAIIGFDDYAWTSITSPPMSTIKQPTTEIGKLAADLLIKRIYDSHREPQNIILDAEFIIRSSC